MAGTIIISSDASLSMNSFHFDYLANMIRQALLLSDGEVASQVFQILDEGGLDIVSARDLGHEKFLIFLRAVERAEVASRENSAHARFGPSWDELRKMIAADPRVPRRNREAGSTQ